MILSLPDEMIVNIIKQLHKTKYHLLMRKVCKKIYKIYDKIPFYKDNKHLANIYINKNSISWRSANKQQKMLKEIIFNSYGRININVYDYQLFPSRDKVVYNLPNHIQKTTYETRTMKIKNINLKDDTIEERIIPTNIPVCIIS